MPPPQPTFLPPTYPVPALEAALSVERGHTSKVQSWGPHHLPAPPSRKCSCFPQYQCPDMHLYKASVRADETVHRGKALAEPHKPGDPSVTPGTSIKVTSETSQSCSLTPMSMPWYTSTRTHMHTHKHETHIPIHTKMHIHSTHTHTNACMHTHAYTHTSPHTYIDTHNHVFKRCVRPRLVVSQEAGEGVVSGTSVMRLLVLAYACYPSPKEADTGGLEEVQSHSWLHGEFEAIPRYMRL